MLFPYFDKAMIEAEETAEKDLENAFNNNTVLVEPTRADENENEGADYKKKLESKGFRTFRDKGDKVSFRDERVKINRKLFRALCSFLHRKNYLELGGIED